MFRVKCGRQLQKAKDTRAYGAYRSAVDTQRPGIFAEVSGSPACGVQHLQYDSIPAGISRTILQAVIAGGCHGHRF